jgi:predicted transcriptional regulator
MIVRHAMSRFPVIVSPRISCSEALRVSRSSGAHFLLVVDGNQLVGVARACDLLKTRAELLIVRSLRVAIVTVGEHEPTALAERMLTRTGGGCLVVTDQVGALKGIISWENLNRATVKVPTQRRQRCETCGAAHHLLFGEPDEPVFCCACVDQARAYAPITLEPVTTS